MKKKNLKGKLSLKVKDLSLLNSDEKKQVKGGLPLTTWSVCCSQQDVSCEGSCERLCTVNQC